MPSAEVEKQLNSKKVVETGIRIRVSISKKMGAATCKNVNSVGAYENPLEVKRW